MKTGRKGWHRQRAGLIGLILLWGILGLGASGHCADDEQTRETLRGLSGVAVLIEELTREAEQAGLTRTQLQTGVELRLRQAGIPVLTEQEWLRTPGRPFLYIRVGTFMSREMGGVFAFHIAVELHQRVTVEQNGV